MKSRVIHVSSNSAEKNDGNSYNGSTPFAAKAFLNMLEIRYIRRHNIAFQDWMPVMDQKCIYCFKKQIRKILCLT